MTVALAGMAVDARRNVGGGSLIGTALAIYSPSASPAIRCSCAGAEDRHDGGADMERRIPDRVSAIILLAPTGLPPEPRLGEFGIGAVQHPHLRGHGRDPLTSGLVLFTLASRSVPAAQLSLIALVEPTLSPLWAWLVARELPPLLTFAGGAIHPLAIAVQALVAIRRRRPAYLTSRLTHLALASPSPLGAPRPLAGEPRRGEERRRS